MSNSQKKHQYFRRQRQQSIRDRDRGARGEDGMIAALTIFDFGDGLVSIEPRRGDTRLD